MKTIKYAKTTEAMRDDKQLPYIQVTYLERVGDAAVANQYGVHASPDKNSPALLLQINGDPSNRVIIPFSAYNRNKGLEESEVEFGNFTKKSYIKFDKDGNVIMEIAANKTVNIAGDCNIDCKGTVNIISPIINLGKATFEKIVKGTKLKTWISNKIAEIYNNHTHPTPAFAKAVDPLSVIPVSATSDTMDKPDVTDLASDAHSVGD